MATAARRLDADASGARLLLWQCPICLDTLCEPMLATCCGQSFCRACLDQSLRRVDACPMCRAPLLSGAHAMTRNRALDELLQRMRAAAPIPEDLDDERDVLLRLSTDGDDDAKPPTTTVANRLRMCLRSSATRLTAGATRLTAGATTYCAKPTVRLQQWRHWLRIHWATLQCVFYVVLFGVFVFFLRVQEEEFAEHESAPRCGKLLRTGDGA